LSCRVCGRLLSPDSTEILQLSGDLRCFLVADSPIAAFLQSPQMLARLRPAPHEGHTHGQDQEEDREQAQGQAVWVERPSFIRALFLLCVSRSVRYLAACLALFAAGAAVRIVLLSG
jgi:hypothetical protein